jgi:hypothetical protein
MAYVSVVVRVKVVRRNYNLLLMDSEIRTFVSPNISKSLKDIEALKGCEGML